MKQIYKNYDKDLTIYLRDTSVKYEDLKPLIVIYQNNEYYIDYYNYYNVPNDIFNIVDKLMYTFRLFINTMVNNIDFEKIMRCKNGSD